MVDAETRLAVLFASVRTVMYWRKTDNIAGISTNAMK